MVASSILASRTIRYTYLVSTMKHIIHIVAVVLKDILKILFLFGVPYLAYYVASQVGHVRFNSLLPIAALIGLFLLCLFTTKHGAHALQSSFFYSRTIGEIRVLSFLIVLIVLAGALVPILISCRSSDTCVTKFGLPPLFYKL